MYELGLSDGRNGNLPVRVEKDGAPIPEDHPVQVAWNDGYADGLTEHAGND